ncbi:hypothetical protein [Hymenobacter terricola]|uniref:hypothetical protein n=1 Tax=Hymenobacter terricola TaxID=2819236 RepID=UPI001B312856|nr:hypothetical protein [Hymenobacter terricola]
MKRPPLPYLLLLPLLVVLLFGNCGLSRGGVRGWLNTMGNRRRDRLQEIVLRERAERAAARHNLHGAAREEAHRRIEQATQARADSLLYGHFEQKKFRNRRNKVERQLVRLPPLLPMPKE